jgi:hypothetical protein
MWPGTSDYRSFGPVPGELVLAEGGMDHSLSPDAGLEESGNYVNPPSGHP